MTIRAATGLLLCAWLSVAATPANRQPVAPAPAGAPLVLANVTVIDGRGGAPHERQTVVIRDGRIALLGPSAATRIPPGAQVLDLAGHTVLPGLIDGHAHLGADRPAIEKYLAFLFNGGITSVRDMAGDSFLYSQLAPAAQEAKRPMARLYYAANWAGPSFWDDRRWVGSTQGKLPGHVPWAREITAATELRAEAAAARAMGVTGIKVYSDIAPDVVARISAAARAFGLKTWSHPAVFPTRPSDVVRSGVDVISHAALFVWEGADALPTTYHSGVHTDFGPPAPYAEVPVTSPPIVRVLDAMQQRGTMLDATVSTIPFSLSQPAAEWGYQFTALARRMGIRVVAGTDRDALQTTDGYPTLFEEIEALVSRCGFSPLEAITAATRHGALALGVEADYGTVEPGKVADLVVVRGHPQADIRRLRDVTHVIKMGQVHRVSRRRLNNP